MTNDMYGIIILLISFGGTLVGGNFVNEQVSGDGKFFGFIMLLCWLLFTLVYAGRYIFGA